MDGFVLSIDQGTTGTTALVFDRDCRVRGRGYTEFTQHYAQPGWDEILREYAVTAAVVTAKTACDTLLRTSSEWELEYTDDKTSVFFRRTPSTGSPGDRHRQQKRHQAGDCAELGA